MPSLSEDLVYMCNCAQLCHGTPRQLQRTQWYEHTDLRAADSPYNHPYLNTRNGLVKHRIARRKRRQVCRGTATPGSSVPRASGSPTADTPSPGSAGVRLPSEDELHNNQDDHFDNFDLNDNMSPTHDDMRARFPSRATSPEIDPPASRPASPLLPPPFNEPPPPLVRPPVLPPMHDSVIDEFATSQKYIAALQNASLDNGDLSEDVLARLRSPPTHTVDLVEGRDRDKLLSLRLFLAQTTGSQRNYTDSVAAIHKADLGVNLLSHHSVSCLAEELSGVSPILHDMCPNSCIAYTAHNKDLDSCPICQQPRYWPHTRKPKARQTFYTIPVGPQIQAMHRHAASAEQMAYFEQQTQQILSDIEGGEDLLETLGDFTTGSDVREAVGDGRLNKDDTVLMSSLDGAQLYRSKNSDCWILIYVVLNVSPDKRYKKRYVLPGGVIPGPNKPKLIESFLHPALHHIAAVNRAGGLPIWDAHRAALGDPERPAQYCSMLCLLLATADGPGMVYMSGLVGHSGKNGCRLWCGLTGRRVPNQRGGHYYPAMAKPHGYAVEGCDHESVPYHAVGPPDPARYAVAVTRVSNARGRNHYQELRLETGISRPSILLGLFMTPERPTILGMPNMCPGNLMHELNNLALHMLKLWRGKIDCIAPDTKDSWHWAVLTGDRWKDHGQHVADSARFLPGIFDCPPRNPAEKINSGYKTWELVQYFYEMGPGLFYLVLPDNIWENICKVIKAVRHIAQKQMPMSQLETTYNLSTDFVEEFEAIYYQQRPERIHFVTQVIHNILHMPHEAVRIGLAGYHAQWTMERTIGNLTEEIKQHSDPYRNLSCRALRRAQVNALLQLFPSLAVDREETSLPSTAIVLPGGFALLRKRDRYTRKLRGEQDAALREYLELNDADPGDDQLKLQRYARLLLANGQVARSKFGETGLQRAAIREACNVKLQLEGQLFAEVAYYFQTILRSETRTLAMVYLFGEPDYHLLKRSSYTLWSCERPGDEDVLVVDHSCIRSVVAMVPFSAILQGAEYANRVFAVEKLGLEVAEMGEAVNNPELAGDDGDLEVDDQVL